MFRTPDEDFGILLEAAVMYDRRVAALLNEEDSTGERFCRMKFSMGISSCTQGCYLSLQVMKLFLHVLDQIHSMNFLLFKNFVLFLLLTQNLLN